MQGKPFRAGDRGQSFQMLAKQAVQNRPCRAVYQRQAEKGDLLNFLRSRLWITGHIGQSLQKRLASLQDPYQNRLYRTRSFRVFVEGRLRRADLQQPWPGALGSGPGRPTPCLLLLLHCPPHPLG